VASAGLALFTATRIAAAQVQAYIPLGVRVATGYDVAFSLALFGAGHLVGLSVGMAMLAGLLIAWAGALPILTYLQPPAAGVALLAHADDIWRHQIRFIGAGAIAISAIWTLAMLAKPVVAGLVSTIASSRATASDDERDRDMSPPWIIGLAVVCLVLAGWLSAAFLAGTPLSSRTAALTAVAVPFTLVGGFLIAAICGYMAGLIGASNSPVSGVGILSIISCASVLLIVAQPSTEMRPALVAFSLFVTAIVFACATISNDNLQDLKTGQLVGASPRRQQVALIIGVIAGAVVIPPVLNLLAHAYGFSGAANVGAVAQNPLPAPQATLISALAQGVIGGNLDWKMIAIGVGVGAVVIAVDASLGLAGLLRLPPLAVGMGIYLPMSSTLAVVIGSIVGHWYNERAKTMRDPGRAERLGVLVASGMIVGESLFGVVNAGLIVLFSNDAPLALVPADFAAANPLGLVSFAVLIAVLYRWMLRRGAAA
jgi:putative OPT family oligopeptide transporter